MESFLEPSSGVYIYISKEPLVINFHGKFLQFKEPFPGEPHFQVNLTVCFREGAAFISMVVSGSPKRW